MSTPSGDIRIEDLSEGDCVWSLEPGTGVAVARRITRLHHGFTAQLIDIVTETVTLRGATPAHPFFEVGTGRWVTARKLTPGRRLLVRRADGSMADECILELVPRSLPAPVEVFNLSVEGDGGYFAEGILGFQKHDGLRPWRGVAAAAVRIPAALAMVVAMGGCFIDQGFSDKDDTGSDITTEGDADTDADTDTDADADTDADSDTDADTDSDADTDPC